MKGEKKQKKTAVRMGDGMYFYRGYSVRRVASIGWTISNSWGQLVATATSLTFAKYYIDDKIAFEERLRGGKRYE